MLLASGENIEVIQGLLGHASSRLTLDVYAHSAPSALDSAARTIDQILVKQAGREGTIEGNARVTPLLPKMDKTRNPLQDAGSIKLGRSRNRTYDPSRVKRVLYR